MVLKTDVRCRSRCNTLKKSHCSRQKGRKDVYQEGTAADRVETVLKSFYISFQIFRQSLGSCPVHYLADPSPIQGAPSNINSWIRAWFYRAHKKSRNLFICID